MTQAREAFERAFMERISELAEKEVNAQMAVVEGALKSVSSGTASALLCIEFTKRLRIALISNRERELWAEAADRAIAIFLPSEGQS
ncbi:hypothetical protein [Diaphorobacter caeni]|uniref:hypothetical protein n=1 Tax=Diaphorobacter caeni TaxID=2784387 RepID=UPI00188FB9D3|nr:hypothetical protein [Diaphorobacter caeni]MBF5007606.1 hypothetical protein [Diaphorobacter caeni]